MLTAEQKIVLNVLSIALLKSLPTQVLSPLTVPQSKAIVVGRPGYLKHMASPTQPPLEWAKLLVGWLVVLGLTAL